MKEVINACFPAPLDPEFQPAILFQNQSLATGNNSGVECLSSLGGDIFIARAQTVRKALFRFVAGRIELRILDECSRRVGQAVAAASLPECRK